MEYSHPLDCNYDFLLQSLYTISQKKDSLEVLSQEDRKVLDVVLNSFLHSHNAVDAIREKGITQKSITNLIGRLDNPPVEEKKKKSSLIQSVKDLMKTVSQRPDTFISASVLQQKIVELEEKNADIQDFKLMNQNIFNLMGLKKGNPEEKIPKKEKRVASEEKIDPLELKASAEKLLNSMSAAEEEKSLAFSPIYTLAHKLYDKAAEAYLEQGDFKDGFEMRAQAANCIPFTPMHPLYQMGQALDNQTNQQADPRLGGYFSSLDTEIVKGGNLHAFNRNIEGQDKHCFQFKLNAFAREELSQTIELFSNMGDELLDFFPKELNIQGITIREKDYTFKGADEQGIFSDAKGYIPYNVFSLTRAKAIEIEWIGLGKVTIGEAPGWSLHNVVNVEVNKENQPGEGAKQLQQMLSLLGLGPVLGAQPPDNDEKIKIAQLFRAYFPREAYKMEVTKEFFTSSPQQMRAAIEAKVPGMIPLFKKYLDTYPGLMKKEEIYPGKTAWAVSDLSQEMRKEGAWGLIAGVTGKDFQSAAQSVSCILKSGSLSSQDRFEAGIFVQGASSIEDLESGGGDQVFTRLITAASQNAQIKNLPFGGHIQVLYDLDVVNRGAYGYRADNNGIKYEDTYSNRPNLIELTRSLRNQPTLANEVMIKNCIAKDKIQGLVVKTPEHKKILIELLSKQGLLTSERDQLYFNGKPIEEFILVATQLNQNLWNSNI